AGVAADLLVGAQADDQVVLGVDAFGVHDLDGGQQRGDGALHVGRAAAVDLAVFVGSREGLVGPALFDRDDVDVGVDRHFLAIGGGRVAAGDEVDAGTLQGQRNGVDVLLGDHDALGLEAQRLELGLDDVHKDVIVLARRHAGIDGDHVLEVLQDAVGHRVGPLERGLLATVHGVLSSLTTFTPAHSSRAARRFGLAARSGDRSTAKG